MSLHPRRAVIALAVAVLILAGGVCLAEAAAHHDDATAGCCPAAIALATIPVPLTLVGRGRVAPVAVAALPGLALDHVVPPPEV